MSNENIEEKLFNRLDRKHEKQIEGKIPELRDNQIYDSLPDNDVFQDQTALNVLNKKMGIPDQEIADSLNRLIEKRKLVTSFDPRNRLYLRKNPFK